MPGRFIPGQIVRPRRKLRERIFRNRHDPHSRRVSLHDVWLNLKEEIYCWRYGIPPGAQLRWRNGRIESARTRHE